MMSDADRQSFKSFHNCEIQLHRTRSAELRDNRWPAHRLPGNQRRTGGRFRRGRKRGRARQHASERLGLRRSKPSRCQRSKWESR